MGNCIVIQKDQSASKLEWSPIKDNTLQLDSLKPQSPPMAHLPSFQDLGGSKDEIYFDATLMMDSDCDDFFSVNGDTPSRGTTPIHPNSTEAPTSNSVEEQEGGGIKQLIEFFRESFSGEMVDRDQYLQGFLETTFDPSPKHKSSPESTPRKHKSLRSAQCCLPNLVRSLSISDRKRRPCSATG